MRVARDVVVAADSVHAPEDRVVGAPAIPEKLDHGDHHCQADAGHRAEHRDAYQADDGQPELPALDSVDATQIPEFEQPDGGGDDHRRQCAFRQVLQQGGAEQQQQRHAQGAEDTGQLSLGAGRFGHGRARRTAADRKALEQAGREVGHAQADHFLVRVHPGACLRRVGT
ncbi:hypothetical protein D9M68_659570 [compost metagenome]